MRGFLACTIGAVALAAMSADAAAGTHPHAVGRVVLESTSDAATSPAVAAPRQVAPGQLVMITGDCVNEAETVNVVLALADPEPRMGWHAMLITDMEREDGNLHVRVPNVPEARHHIFSVRVYAGDSEDACVCEAGQIRIG
jgi:hypothetical protein